jgi:hypothetical protein
LQQGNANSYATIELDAENDADLTNIVYEDTTADLNENQKLSLS